LLIKLAKINYKKSRGAKLCAPTKNLYVAIRKHLLQIVEFAILEEICLSKSKMLEISQHYILNDAGEPIAIQIPIAQFEALLKLVNDPTQVQLLPDDGNWTVEELQQAAKIGMMALEGDRYTDYDVDGLQNLFDGIKQNDGKDSQNKNSR
jgi:hypothetical protein